METASCLHAFDRSWKTEVDAVRVKRILFIIIMMIIIRKSSFWCMCP